MIQNLDLNGIDSDLVSHLISKIKKKELIQKLQQQFQQKEIIYSQLIKIIKASSILENFEQIAGKAMLILRKMFKIIQNENFSKIKLKDSSLEGMCFINCNFQGSQMENVKLIACRFVRCCFDNVNWKNMISQEQTVLQGDKNDSEFRFLSISPDETMFATCPSNVFPTCTSDNSIQLWDLKTYEKVKRLKMHKTIYQIGLLSNKLLVVRLLMETQIWNIGSGKLLQQYKIQRNLIDYDRQLSLQQLIICCFNHKCQIIYLFTIQKGKVLRKYSSFNLHPQSEITFNATCLLAIKILGNKIIAWNFQKGEQQFEVISNIRQFTSPQISLEGDFLALIYLGHKTYDAGIQIWDIKKQIMLRQIEMNFPLVLDCSKLVVQFSKNGTILACLDGFQNIHFIDIFTNQIIMTLNNLCISKFSLLLYPKTNIILSYQNNNIMLLDPTHKQKVEQIILDQQKLIFNSIFFSNEGKQILVSYNKTKIQIIDLVCGENLKKKDIKNAVQVTCSLDLQAIAFLKRDQKIVYLYDIKQQKVFNQLINNFKVNSIAISPDKLTLACGNEDSSISLFNLKTLQPIQIYNEQQKAVKIVLFSQDGQKLVSGALDRTIRIWDLRNDQVIAKLEQDNENFVIALSLDSNFLAQDSKQHIIFWDLKSQTQLSHLQHKDKAKTILFLNYFLILGQFSYFYLIWDYKTGLIVRRLHNIFWYSVSFSPKSKILAIIQKEDLQLFTIQQEKNITKLTTYESSIISIKICSRNSTLVTFLKDYSLNIWDLELNLQMKKIEEQESIINSFSLGQSGNTLVYGCKDSTICLWDIKSLQQMQKFKSHQGVNSIDFSHDEQYLAFGCQNGMIYLWDIKGQKQSSKEIATNYSSITQILFLKDQIITLHSDNSIHFLNIKEQLQELGFYKHSSVINSVTLSFDQQTLAFGSNDGKVYILNVSSRTIVQEYTFHNDKVNCVAFSSDDKYLASGSDDESVFSNEGKVSALVHLQDKQVIVQGNENGVVNMISFDQKKIDLIKIYGKDSLSLKGTKSSFSDAKITSSNGFDLVKVLQKDQ